MRTLTEAEVDDVSGASFSGWGASAADVITNVSEAIRDFLRNLKQL